MTQRLSHGTQHKKDWLAWKGSKHMIIWFTRHPGWSSLPILIMPRPMPPWKGKPPLQLHQPLNETNSFSYRKPVYVTFGGQCRGHLLQFQRWLRDQRLTRKLRLDRKHKPSHHQKQPPLVDPYSYLGHHPSFAIAAKVFAPATMDHVIHELETIRQEKITGKRRQD